MRKRILITGIGGSIGCHVLAYIIAKTDWDVVGIDSFRHRGLCDRAARMLYHFPQHHNRIFTFTHDLRAPISNMLMDKLGSIDYIINLASLSDVHDSDAHPVEFITSNVAIVLNMLEYARVVKPTTFIQMSTDEVYGPTDGTWGHVEWAPIVPSNPYSASKAAQEAIAISYWRSYDVPLIITNAMNNFGEMQSPAKFPSIVQRKVRRGEPIQIHVGGNGEIGSRWYIHSHNTADALLFLLHKIRPLLHVSGAVDRPVRYNIVGDKQVDNLTMAKMIASYIGLPLSYEFTQPRNGHDIHYGLDGLALKAAGWKSPLTLEESLQRTVDWYEKNPEWLEAR